MASAKLPLLAILPELAALEVSVEAMGPEEEDSGGNRQVAAVGVVARMLEKTKRHAPHAKWEAAV